MCTIFLYTLEEIIRVPSQCKYGSKSVEMRACVGEFWAGIEGKERRAFGCRCFEVKRGHSRGWEEAEHGLSYRQGQGLFWLDPALPLPWLLPPSSASPPPPPPLFNE